MSKHHTSHEAPKKNRLTLYIFIALLMGIGLGFLLNTQYVQQDNALISQIDQDIESLKQKSVVICTEDVPTALKRLSEKRSEIIKSRDSKLEPFSLIADIFLRLIKMIVAPLVFSTLVVGVAKLGDIKAVGRIGGKTLLWFFSEFSSRYVFG
jgi:Na+/H+-dicarboxylate symporter